MFHLLIKPLLGVAGEAVKGIVATKKAKAEIYKFWEHFLISIQNTLLMSQ